MVPVSSLWFRLLPRELCHGPGTRIHVLLAPSPRWVLQQLPAVVNHEFPHTKFPLLNYVVLTGP